GEVGEKILLFFPRPGLIGNLSIRRVDDPARGFGPRPAVGEFVDAAGTASRVAQAAHPVYHRDPEPLHVRLAVRPARSRPRCGGLGGFRFGSLSDTGHYPKR